MAFSDDKIVPVLIRSSSAMFPRIHLPTPAPINRPSSAPVSSATLSFSVGRILAMEDGLARRSFPASSKLDFLSDVLLARLSKQLTRNMHVRLGDCLSYFEY